MPKCKNANQIEFPRHTDDSFLKQRLEWREVDKAKWDHQHDFALMGESPQFVYNMNKKAYNGFSDWSHKGL